MIELTSGYKTSVHPKFMINPAHIVYVAVSDQSKNSSFEGVNCYVEYIGGSENQVSHVKETYEQIKEMLK